jgi:hypothetical protein
VKKEREKMLSMTIIPAEKDHKKESEAQMARCNGNLTNSIAAFIKRNVKKSISECKN